MRYVLNRPWIAIAALLFVLIGPLLPPAAAQDGPAVRTIDVLGEAVQSVLSPDGRTLAVWEDANFHANEVIPPLLPIRLVDIESGEVRGLAGHPDYAFDAAFSPDSATLASYHANGWIIMWDVATGTEIKRIPATPGGARIQFLPDGKTLAAIQGGPLAPIQFWDIEREAITHLLIRRFDTYYDQMQALEGTVPGRGMYAMAAAPQGDRMVTATLGGTIWLWDLATGEPTLLREGDDARPMVNIRQLAFTESGAVIVFDYQAGILFALDPETGEETELLAIERPGSPLAMTPDASRAAWLDTASATIYVAGLEQPDSRAAIPLPESANELIPAAMGTDLAFTPDGSRLVFTGYRASSDYVNAVVVVDLNP